MIIELTPRSQALIAREQARNGAISPEQLVEAALENYTLDHTFPTLTPAQLRAHIQQGLADADAGDSLPLEEAWNEINHSLARG